MAADGRGFVWVATLNGVLRVDREKLLRGDFSDGGVREYGLLDGLGSVEGVRRQRSVVADGARIWFSLGRGLSMIDPTRPAGGSMPAITHVVGISADGTPVGSRRERPGAGWPASIDLHLHRAEPVGARARAIPVSPRRLRRRLERARHHARSDLYEPRARTVSLSRHVVEQRRAVESRRVGSRHRDRAAVVANDMVPRRECRCLRARCSGHLPAAHAPGRARAERPVRGAARRAHAHRPGSPRHAAAGIRQRLDAAARRR